MAEITDAMGLPAERVRRVLADAGRAPSLHNTQPWLFRLTPSAIELCADPRRRLPATDPDGVELRVSCGAALFNLRDLFRPYIVYRSRGSGTVSRPARRGWNGCGLPRPELSWWYRRVRGRLVRAGVRRPGGRAARPCAW